MKKPFRFILLILCLGIFGAAAQAASTEKIQEKAQETAAATAEYAHQSKEEFRQSMEKQLADLKVQIHQLRNRVSRASGDAKISLDKNLKSLENKRKEVNRDLDAASKKSGVAWENMRGALVKAVDDIKTGFASAEKSLQSSQSKSDEK